MSRTPCGDENKMTTYFSNCTMLQVIEKQHCLSVFELSRRLELELLNTVALSTLFQIPDERSPES